MDVKTQKKLNYLDETKQLIRDAIEEMGQTVTDTDTFRSYAEKIRAAKPVLQDKTITENGTYTADEGFDGLGEVTVDVAGSGGGSTTGLRSKEISMTLTGEFGSRVSIDFGFKPLMIVIYPGNKLSVANSVNFTCIGSVSELGFSERISYVYSNKITTQLQGGYIDSDDINKPIYNADETGFNLGKKFAAGSYYVYALGL